MLFPETLRPTSTEEFWISESRSVAVPKTTPKFQPWRGSPLNNTYGGKVVLEFGGKPLFAELVILRYFESCGWRGAWIDTFRKRTLTDLDLSAQLPTEQRALLNRIAVERVRRAAASMSSLGAAAPSPSRRPSTTVGTKCGLTRSVGWPQRSPSASLWRI
jgi:hypothetical protein